MQSTANVSVNTRDDSGVITGQLFLGNDEVVMLNKRFRIKTDQDKQIMYADKDKVVFNTGTLEFEGEFHRQ